jgi:CheY-like chemotaxis protein
MTTNRKYHILIVDDSRSVRAFFADIFSNMPGFRPDTAASGAEAIEVLKSKHITDEDPFDFLLTDINMPEMDGFAVIDAAKELDPDLKTGMITGFNVDDYINMALDRGVFNIICKMDDPADIVRTVYNLITGENIFGLVNYVEPGTEITRINVTDTAALKVAVNRIMEYAEQKLNEDKLYGLKTGLVEMGTNAIYHAYGYEKGSQVTLKETEEVALEYGMDAEKLAVAILDVSGILTKERVLTQLNKGINPTHEDLIAAGGRGIYLTRFLCDKVVVNLAQKQRTEVILIMNFSEDYKESKPLLINQI